MTNADTSTEPQAAAVAEQGAQGAPENASSKKGASQKKAAPKAQKSAKGAKPKATAAATPKKTAAAQKAPKAQKAAGPREGAKTAQVIALLQRKNGATLAEIMEKMNWQKHYADVGINGTAAGGLDHFAAACLVTGWHHPPRFVRGQSILQPPFGSGPCNLIDRPTDQRTGEGRSAAAYHRKNR